MANFFNKDKTESTEIKCCEVFKNDSLLTLIIDSSDLGTDKFHHETILYYYASHESKCLSLIPYDIETSRKCGGSNEILNEYQWIVRFHIIP